MCKEYYEYPFKSIDSKTPEILETRQNEFQGVINNYLEATRGVAVEIGGPTENGYRLLNGVYFKNGLIISNAYPETEDISRIDITASLPFENNSVGCVVSSCLPLIDLTNPLRDPREINVVIKKLDFLASNLSKGVFDNFSPDGLSSISPRTALIKEAHRVLEVGGLFIIKSLLDSELQIIKSLGFNEVASAEYSVSKPKTIWIQKEYAFRLEDPSRKITLGDLAIKNLTF